MPPGDPWTDLRNDPPPPPSPRWWRRWKLDWVAFFVTLVAPSTIAAAYAESKARVRDAVQLRESNELKALCWLAAGQPGTR